MSGIYNFLLLCPVIWISNKYGYIYQKLLKIWPYLSEMLILFTSRRLCLLKMFSVRKEVRISKLIVLSSAALGEVQCIELRWSLIHRTSTVLILLTESFPSPYSSWESQDHKTPKFDGIPGKSATFLSNLKTNWCERCLLITESPKTPGHYRYLMWVLDFIP